MTFSQAIETIEKYQDNINDQVVRMDDVFAPDEYYLAVSAILPMFKCMNCLSNWASRDNIIGDFPFESDNSRQFIPRCEDESNYRPDVQYSPEDLPYVQEERDEELPFE